MDRKSTYYLQCGILQKWHDKTFAEFVNDKEAKGVVLKYIDDADKFFKEGVGMFLYGNHGVGKTMLMNLVFKALLEKRYSVRVISMSTLVSKFKSGWYNETDKQELHKMLKTVDFLGIEEIGKEFKAGGTDLSLNVLDNVLRVRVQMLKPVWCTSNIAPANLSSVYTEGIASMLREAAIPLVVNGGDYRKLIAEKLTKYKR